MVFVAIPTYNEKENLPVLVRKIFDLKIADLKILVVDDNSPDGTGKIADELAKQYPMAVLHRQMKEGLGKAYVNAFKEILRQFQDEPLFVVQMDADLSHDPSVIPEMLAAARSCDVVIGSRYMKGGRIENWDFFRRLVSRFGNWYAQLVLGLPYRDLTGGFKCWRKKVVESMELDSLSSVGYNFQIETTYWAYKKGYKICEIPITFTERKTGVSKFNLGIMLEAFWKVLLLRIK